MAPATDPEWARAVLAASDRVWETLTITLGIPAPAGDLGDRWDLFLVDAVEDGGTARGTGRDPLARLDGVASFGLLDRGIPPGCGLDLAIARSIVRGSLWRTAPATDEGSAVAETESLARLASACVCCAEMDAEAFQAAPESALVEPSDPAYERGAAAFFDWLDATFASSPGALVPAVWALSPTASPYDSVTWASKPTGFDVLRISLKGALWNESTIDDVFVGFAVHRALSAPPARLAWDIPWPALPRRLAAPVPPSATGASFVEIRHAGAPMGAKLRLIAQWEDYGRMRWVVLKVGPDGSPMGRLDVTSADRATRAALDVEELDGVDRLLAVGVNLGSIEYPFDPGQGSWVQHGWLLTLESE